ncbi:MAG: hypothetical protein ACLR6J_05155 [Parabacteroides merdae]
MRNATGIALHRKREVKRVAFSPYYSSGGGLCGTFEVPTYGKELSARLHELEAQHTAVCLTTPSGKRLLTGAAQGGLYD